MKVISGAQTGADKAGLVAARSLGIETGGWMPAGFRTSEGSRPSYQYRYGMKVTKSSGYPDRTRKNVEESDGTVWFGNPKSAGGKLTLRTAKKLGKPVLKVSQDIRARDAGRELATWIRKKKIKTLNVAGNREETNLGIFAFTYSTMLVALRAVADRRK